MSSLGSVLDIASRALQINQKGIGVASHNIANIDRPAYSRQRQVLVAAPGVPDRTGIVGTGVEQLTIQRVSDAFMQNRLIQEHSSKGSLSERSNALAQIESIVNEQGGEGLTTQLSRFYDALSELEAAPSPGQPVERANTKEVANALIETFHRIDRQLRQLQTATSSSMDSLVKDINAITARIADINQKIVGVEAVAPANDLRDERDALLQELSEKVEISTFENPNGSVVVMIQGGMPLVQGNRADRLSASAPATPNPFNPSFNNVYFDDGSNFFDVTATIGGGELGGLIDARDNVISTVIRDLDQIAFDFSERINTRHAAGRGLTDATSRTFFGALGTATDAARSISLHADIAAIGGEDHIAAGQPPGPTSADAGDTTNAGRMADTRSDSLRDGATLISGIGLRSRTVQQDQLQQQRVLEDVQSRRDEQSGVSLDEEVTSLVRLQANYQANARVITTVNAMLQELTNLL